MKLAKRIEIDFLPRLTNHLNFRYGDSASNIEGLMESDQHRHSRASNEFERAIA
jgi:hypothetical protein